MTLATTLLVASLLAAPPDAATAAPATAAPAVPPPITLLGAGALGPGGAAVMGEVGFPYLQVTYAQSVGPWDDLGMVAGADWTTGEILLAFLWRRELAGDAGSRAGFRLVVGPSFNFGATWDYPGNQPNLGLLLAPGVAWTASVARGLLSVGLDLGMEWAMQRGQGFAVQPRLGLSYEAPVGKELTVGARAGVAARWGWGSAHVPGMDDRLLGAFTAMITWRIF